MSIPFDIIESDSWPLLRQKIAAERDARLNGLIGVTSLDEMRRQQGFLEALDWIVEEAKPRTRQAEDDDDD